MRSGGLRLADYPLAVQRAADLMRHGNRSQVLVLLGGAAVPDGYLRDKAQTKRLHDATPAG
jgi:hypothetical protein